MSKSGGKFPRFCFDQMAKTKRKILCNFTYLLFRYMGVYLYHDKGTDNPYKTRKVKTMYVIKKENKYVQDFTDGRKLTTNIALAERYTNKKAAETAARAYGKKNGKGYTVVKLF